MKTCDYQLDLLLKKKKLARASSQMQAQFRPESFLKAEKTFWSHVSPPLSGGISPVGSGHTMMLKQLRGQTQQWRAEGLGMWPCRKRKLTVMVVTSYCAVSLCV